MVKTQSRVPSDNTSCRVGGSQIGDCSHLRVDAQRNRDRIVAAAQEVFAESGLNAALEVIARRAGVGIATLYRRFPTRPTLIAASFEKKMAEYAAAAEHALSNPDPWAGFCWLINKVCAMQADDAGLKDFVTMKFPTPSVVEDLRTRAHKSLEQLIQRAQRQGTLRADFAAADVPMLLCANAGIVSATREDAPDAWRRFTAYMIDACRADRTRIVPATPKRS